MLARLRRRTRRFFHAIAAPLSVLSANTYTLLGLVLAAIFPVSLVYNPLLGLLVLLASGFFDAIDGAVARYRGEASKRGEFIDSVTDRVSDLFYAYGFLVYGYSSYLVLGVLGFSMLISYIRAKYELVVGHSMEGIGVMERADRIIYQAVVLLVDILVNRGTAIVLYGVFLALVAATALHRAYRALRDIG